MATSINASTSGAGGLITTADASGQLELQTAGTTAVTIDSSQVASFTNNLGTVAGYPAYQCRAWVNFNGTGTVAILASGNVSSITDNGTGDYTVNFTTAMPDANYAVNTSNAINSTYTTPAPSDQSNPIVFSTSSVRVQTGYFSGSQVLRDQGIVCISIFR